MFQQKKLIIILVVFTLGFTILGCSSEEKKQLDQKGYLKVAVREQTLDSEIKVDSYLIKVLQDGKQLAEKEITDLSNNYGFKLVAGTYQITVKAVAETESSSKTYTIYQGTKTGVKVEADTTNSKEVTIKPQPGQVKVEFDTAAELNIVSGVVKLDGPESRGLEKELDLSSSPAVVELTELAAGSWEIVVEFVTEQGKTEQLAQECYVLPDRTNIFEFSAVKQETEFTLTLAAESGGELTPAAGTYTYAAGSGVTLTASPNDGAEFVKWVAGAGDLLSTANPYTFQLNSSRQIKAVFNSVPSNDNNGFEYNGEVYRGQTTAGSDNPETSYDSQITVTNPEVREFTADGYFRLTGQVDYSGDNKYAIVYVTKDSTGEQTSYWVTGSFSKRIWLRFGSGDYTVNVHKVEIKEGNTIEELYDGTIESWMYYNPARYTFNVTNSRSEDGKYYYPSDPIQSADQLIQEQADTITRGITDQYQQIQAIHDWVVKYLAYDDASLLEGQRKKQDAVATFNYQIGVCEGYTSLFAALARAEGFRVKAVAGTSDNGGLHAWNNIYYDGQWYLVDTTFDDPGPNDDSSEGINLRYDYFMKSVGSRHDKDTDRPQLNIIKMDSNPDWPGYPAGTY